MGYLKTITKEYNNSDLDCYNRVNFEVRDGEVETALFKSEETDEMLNTLNSLEVAIHNGSTDQIRKFINSLKKDLEFGINVISMLQEVGEIESIENEEKVEEIGE